ncbi:MAG: O-antigen ligase family protein, partial [Planctomycetes bacterium]|nr:O-antigen ligase family protein [Planctomycetota bacterium]
RQLQSQRPARARWWLLFGGVAFLSLIAIGLMTGGLDRLVLSESAKSLRYRWEYWNSSWQMQTSSARNFLLGVGPGNFRQSYLEFKLPQSSEEIADPHNLFLDAWANGGLLGLCALVGLCGLCVGPCLEILVLGGQRGQIVSGMNGHSVAPGRDRAFWSILVGGVGSFLVLYVLGQSDDTTLLALFSLWIVLLVMSRAVFESDLSRAVASAGAVGLIVHLCGAGGLGMPGISQLLLFLAIGTVPFKLPVVGVKADGTACAVDRSVAGESRNRTPSWPFVLFGCVGLGLYLACWMTGVVPVLSVREKLAAGQAALYERGLPQQAEREFRVASEVDVWAALPCERLAELSLQNWQATGRTDSEWIDKAIHWQRLAVRRDPKNYGVYRLLGEIYLAKFGEDRNPATVQEAVAALRQATDRYPHHAMLQSLLAEACWKAGLADSARSAAQQAIQLDEINARAGHTDKRLPESRQAVLQQILGSDSN